MATYNFTIRVTDNNGTTSTVADSITVTPLPIILSGDAPDGAAGDVYSFAYTATNAVAPVTYTVDSGTLPPGVTLNAATGELSGTLA